MNLTTITMPRQDRQRYYDPHFTFFRNLFEAAGVEVKTEKIRREGRGFEVQAAGKKILIDYGDHFTSAPDLDSFDACFRYHFSKEAHGNQKRTYPFTPISFHDWHAYKRHRATTRWRPGSRYVTSRQTPGAAALQRRRMVQHRMREHFGASFDSQVIKQDKFWGAVSETLISICVPGARNDILDRGQLQYWALGCPTISPQLTAMLPYWEEPLPGKHYLRCADNYLGLDALVDIFMGNVELLRKISVESILLFEKCCTPKPVVAWFEQVLGGI